MPQIPTNKVRRPTAAEWKARLDKIGKKRPSDPNQLAKSIIDLATADKPAPKAKKKPRAKKR